MFSRRVWTFVLTVMLVPVVSAAQSPQGPRLVLPDFDHLAKRASESVNLSLDTSLLSLAARLPRRQRPGRAVGEGVRRRPARDLRAQL